MLRVRIPFFAFYLFMIEKKIKPTTPSLRKTVLLNKKLLTKKFKHKKLIKGFKKADGSYDNWMDYYKVAFRKMVSSSSERTLSGAIIPPKTTHIFGLISTAFIENKSLMEFTGLTSSLIFDFLIPLLLHF